MEEFEKSGVQKIGAQLNILKIPILTDCMLSCHVHVSERIFTL